MEFRSRSLTGFLFLLAGLCLAAGKAEAGTFGIGFFEGGSYPAHAEFRNYFRDQLRAMTPPGVELVFVPDGFKSADWDREKSRSMARQLVQNTQIDLVVALGPWTVEDLLEAGFDRPIVAAFRYDPVVEGLVDDRSRPIVDNLTVRVRPNKLTSDLRYLTGLLPVRKLGVLYFPASNEIDTLLAMTRELGKQLGFEVVTAEGYDRNGTYAFFKAYRQLAGKVDALYLSPLWGFNSNKVRQFYAMVSRDNIPSFIGEGQYHAARGALAAGSLESSLTRAHYHAWKVVQIMRGASPAALPTILADDAGLIINQQVAHQLGMTVRSERRYDITVLEAPAPDDVERLTVVDAVAVALAQNPGYQARYETLESAGQAASEAWSSYLPQVSLDATVGHFDHNSVNNDDRYRADRYRADLNLSQELFSLGVIRDIELAGLRRDEVQSDLKQAGLDLELGVTLAFLNLVRAEQVKSVELAHRRQVRDCLQLARLRLELKEGDVAEVWRWEGEWLNAVQSVRRTEGDLEIARILLNTLLGRPGDYSFVVDRQHYTDSRFFYEESVLVQATSTPETKTWLVQSLLDELADGHPSLTRAHLGVSTGHTRLAQNRADFYPRIGFFATLGLTRELVDRPGFEEKSPSWSVGAKIKLPLFEGGRRFRRQNRLRSELNGLEYRRDQVALEVTAQMRVAVERMLIRSEEFPIAARSAELADRYFPEILAQFGSGHRTNAELLDALMNDRHASLNAIAAQIDYFRSVAEVVHTLGVSPNANSRSPGEELLIRISSITSNSRN